MASIPVVAERLSEVFDSDPRSATVIAEYFSVSKQTISAWRNGERSPKLKKLKEIAAFYGKPVEWFFGFDIPKEEMPVPKKEDEQVKEIMSLLAGLSDQKKAEAIRYLRYLSSSGGEE